MLGSETEHEHQSICHVRASELFPKRPLEREDKHLQIPFQPICGEAVEVLGRTADGVLALSNYRMFLQLKEAYYNVPLGLIETVEMKDIFYLYIGCKDARSLRCTFSTNEQCQEWHRRIIRATSPPKQIEDVFAFAYHAWATEEGGEEVVARLGHRDSELNYFKSEVERLGFDVNGAWRISRANCQYKLCPSYPRHLLVPACVTDESLESAARFRSARRVPAVSWRHVGNGAVIARCSQPEVGWLGWRSSEDEDLIRSMGDACAFDRGRNTVMDGVDDEPDGRLATPSDSTYGHTPNGHAGGAASGGDAAIVNGDIEHSLGKKVLIMDARSYTTAVANRARGGGCECPEYYPQCEIQFMNLANIHSIRKSFHAVRQLCGLPDTPNWLSMLDNSKWLHHLSGLLRAAVGVAVAVEREARPVLVHCSDGWDRTPQIVSLAQILLDPHYRTIEGFQTLVYKEWLEFGHKFADRCGHSVNNEDVNERCPVFLQWLDCVHQLLVQFPCSFQYSQDYLVKLAQHTYSNLFGTFLCNSSQERSTLRVSDRTFSVWRFLKAPNFRNYLYCADGGQVLWPSSNVRDLVLWNEVYIGSVEASVSRLSDEATPPADARPSPAPMAASGASLVSLGLVKTRSFDDLMTGSGDLALHDEQPVLQGRRSSHPSLASEIKLEALQLSTCSNNSSGAVTNDVAAESKSVEGGVAHSSVSEAEPPVTAVPLENGFLVRLEDGVDQVDGPIPEIRVYEKNTNGTNSEGEERGGADVDEVRNNRDGREGKSSEEWRQPPSSGGEEERRRKNRTISEELCDNFADRRDFEVEVDVCDDLEEVQDQQDQQDQQDSSPQSSTDTLIGGVKCGGDACRICTHVPTKREGREGHRHKWYVHKTTAAMDIDGLQQTQEDVQARVSQMVSEYRARQQVLERELHAARLALTQQSCQHGLPPVDTTSRPESTCSASNPGSLPSDLSWEAVDDSPLQQTLWVPDHAVTRCQGCDCEFWIGRRKHHCRNCGKIFCSDCSDQTAALPGEHLYEPVRVCNTCHTTLSSTCPLLAPHHTHQQRLVESCKKASASVPDSSKITSSKTATT